MYTKHTRHTWLVVFTLSSMKKKRYFLTTPQIYLVILWCNRVLPLHNILLIILVVIYCSRLYLLLTVCFCCFTCPTIVKHDADTILNLIGLWVWWEPCSCECVCTGNGLGWATQIAAVDGSVCLFALSSPVWVKEQVSLVGWLDDDSSAQNEASAAIALPYISVKAHSSQDKWN